LRSSSSSLMCLSTRSYTWNAMCICWWRCMEGRAAWWWCQERGRKETGHCGCDRRRKACARQRTFSSAQLSSCAWPCVISATSAASSAAAPADRRGRLLVAGLALPAATAAALSCLRHLPLMSA
jgi:hypothetical protein